MVRQPSPNQQASPRLRPRVIVVLLAAALCVLAACTASSREAALLLADIAAGDGPSHLKDITPAPLRQERQLRIGEKSYLVDFYLPRQPVAAGLLLVPGAAETGKGDPRLIAFATSLARARFAVMVPELPSLKRLQVNAGNIDELRALFGYLVFRPELAPGGRAGILAFSYAAGPALLVALDADIGRQVSFVFAVGPYYSLDEVLTFFTTGYYEEDGQRRHMKPNAYGKWVFVLSNVDRLKSKSDRKLLTAMAERKKADLSAHLEDLAERLGPEGESVFRFVTNRDPNLVANLKRDLPASIRSDMNRLDLANKDLSTITSRVILVHGFGDDIIPYTQSVALHQALKDRADLYLVTGLDHVDLKPGLVSKFRLWRSICTLLQERDRSAEAQRP